MGKRYFKQEEIEAISTLLARKSEGLTASEIGHSQCVSHGGPQPGAYEATSHL
jgi:hypothetical protein